LHDYQAGTPSQLSYCIELWDIGGYKNHMNSRSVFYSNTDGIILVYDVTNKKSENNLDDWINEISKCNFEPRWRICNEKFISGFNNLKTGWISRRIIIISILFGGFIFVIFF